MEGTTVVLLADSPSDQPEDPVQMCTPCRVVAFGACDPDGESQR